MENRWASDGGEETKQKTSGGLSRVGAEFRRMVRSEDAGTLQACDESAEALESSSGRDDSLGGWQHGESPNPLRTLSGGQPQRTLLGGQLRRSGPSGKLVWRSTTGHGEPLSRAVEPSQESWRMAMEPSEETYVTRY
ncbi:hypothetical protein ILYODFUR_034646, partial [Ilyodon furcidens]